ncbi:MAG TPA: DinB family protein [Blastocatellia bacterium]|jgi:uncharacterized damage-inducible protein DinB|nr:DinB family protein [Blastocatellia bacterium]
MTKIEEFLSQWGDAREGLIKEAERMLQFTLAHEMYHRGQLTVYQRLLGIEPALTEQFRQLTSQKQ